MKLFVSKNDRIDVEVFVFENDKGDVEAVTDATEVPPSSSGKSKILKFIFRKPGYSDSHNIFSAASQTNKELTGMVIDPIALQDHVLKNLLVDWDLTSENGERMDCTQKNIASLLPPIGRAAAAGLLSKISI